MARKKQTARPSTGEKACWKPLASSRSHAPLYYNYGKRPSQQHINSENHLVPNTASNPHTAMSSAAQEMVLSTPDLLIIILSQLPHSSLLKAKGVNKTWASLFGHAEIQAALFQRPRPKASAMHAETYSDILMDRFGAFWPINGEDKAVFSKRSTVKTFHPETWSNIPINVSNSHDPSQVHSQETKALQP